MTDRRSTPDPHLVDGTAPAQIIAPHIDLLARPKGPRDRQLLAGASVTVLGQVDGHAYVRADQDEYIGFVASGAVGSISTATHQVTTPAAHGYSRASIKSPETATLSFGARVTALAETPDFVETTFGHVPKAQLSQVPFNAPACDTARLFLGTPYLWGGNTRAGIDCSGLVQIALISAGIPCPGDSDQQEAFFSDADDACKPGDLLFWEGHVALVTSATRMIHANATHMTVVEEAIDPATKRIAANGGGAVTGHKRP